MSTATSSLGNLSVRSFLALLLVFAITAFVTTRIIMTSAPSVFSDSLVTLLKNGGKTTAIVKMVRETQEVLDQIEAEQFPSREAKATAMTTRLQALADETQKDLKAFLDSQSPPVEYASMWISNTLVVKEASLDLLQKMEKLGGIKEIREEHTAHIMGGGGGGIGML